MLPVDDLTIDGQDVKAVTLSVDCMLAARKVVIVAAGERKREAVSSEAAVWPPCNSATYCHDVAETSGRYWQL